MSETDPRGEIARRAHEALQRLRGLEPSQPPVEPVAEAAWLLETDGGRRHPLDVVASGSLHPALAKLGFKRQGRTWNRRSGGLVQVINLQGSKYNVLTRLSPVLFYVNIGVFIPEVHELVWAEPPPAFVREAYCQIRHRLNALAREPKRLIMALEPTRSLEQQGEELTREILDYGVSYLDRLNSLEAVDQVLAEMLARGAYHGDVFAPAYVAQAVGDHGRAARLVLELYPRIGKDSLWQGRIARLAARVGVELPSREPTRHSRPADFEVEAAVAHVGSERGTSSTGLIVRERRASGWHLTFAGCTGIHDEEDVRRTVERMAAVGLVPSLGPWDAESTPKLVTDLTTWMQQVHVADDVWRRWRNSSRKLSRTRWMEHWSSAALGRGLGWKPGGLSVSRYGRDNWQVAASVSTWQHADAGFHLEAYAQCWADLLLRLVEDLRATLRPELTILLASDSYSELTDDLERGALLIGWRTWYGPGQVKRFGREFLLGLPDHTYELEDGTIAHRLNTAAHDMVLPRSGKYARLRPYLAHHTADLAWPRL